MAEPYRCILLCVDFTDDAAVVARRAQELACRYDAVLHLVHVVEQFPVDAASEFMAPPRQSLQEDLLASAGERLRAVARELSVSEEQCCVLEGYTKQEILRHAEELDCDLIVVGSHGRHGLSLLLGSTATALLRGARCDVLGVRV